jgi:hypothetical protein
MLTLSIIKLGVVLVNVIMLSVVAPIDRNLTKYKKSGKSY